MIRPYIEISNQKLNKNGVRKMDRRKRNLIVAGVLTFVVVIVVGLLVIALSGKGEERKPTGTEIQKLEP